MSLEINLNAVSIDRGLPLRNRPDDQFWTNLPVVAVLIFILFVYG